MASYQELFTPLFIIMSICIMIGGLVGLQFIDRLFAGSQNLCAIRMFGITILINFIILLFLFMSFSKVKFSNGGRGPTGNRGERGSQGLSGGLNICNKKPRTVEEQKTIIKNANYLDMKAPLINTD